MVRTDLLRGLIAQKGKSQSDVAKALGITPKTFYTKMKTGIFGSDEMEALIQLLDIDNPADIFFAKA